MKQRLETRSWPFVVVAVLVILGELFLAGGCGSPSATKASTPPIPASQAVTSRWPAFLAAVILNRGGGFSVVGPRGVIFEELRPVPQPETTVTMTGLEPPSYKPTAGLIVSGDNKLVAYVFPGEDLVVRTVADGKVLRKVPFALSGWTRFGALSDDGKFMVIAPTSGSAMGEPGDQTPWTLTILDLADGKQAVAASLASLVKTRLSENPPSYCGLVGMNWLPDDRLLVGLSGTPFETYIYDPATDTLQLVPNLGYVWAVSPDGVVLGQDMVADRIFVWHDGTSEPVVLDEAWSGGGTRAISADGKVLALLVYQASGQGTLTEQHGWQIFTRVGSEWRSAGPVAKVNWINQPPGQASSDGKVAWNIVSTTTSQTPVNYLLSHDFVSGRWDEWFLPRDMRPDFGSFSLAAAIPSD